MRGGCEKRYRACRTGSETGVNCVVPVARALSLAGVVAFIILLAVFGIVAYRITSPEERTRYLHIALKTVGQLKVAATRRHPESDAFHGVLRTRTPHLVITPAIAAIDVAVFVCMLFGASAISVPDTWVGWGAS